MLRRHQYKLLVLALACGLLPAWLLRGDRASLNHQRGFWQGLGENISAALVDGAVRR